jgi:hypothetical protein
VSMSARVNSILAAGVVSINSDDEGEYGLVIYGQVSTNWRRVRTGGVSSDDEGEYELVIYWWRVRTGGEYKLVASTNWWRVQTGGEYKLVASTNWQ